MDRPVPRPHQSNLRKGRHSEPLGLYFLTKRSLHELDERQRDDIVTAFMHGRTAGRMRLYAFVVMPDHWHALVSLGNRLTLSQAVASLCRHASFAWRAAEIRYGWQRGFHDHKLRPAERVVDVVNYIEANPGRKGLVSASSEWRWSSANAANRAWLDREFLGHERWEGG